MNEEPLVGGELSAVVRVGDTVRRPATSASPELRETLRQLEQAGFDAAPRWLGVDDRGRDVLTWIEGETFADRGRLHPYLGSGEPVVLADEQVAAAFRLLRRFHDAAGVCHGDFGPWNLVWRDGLPVALIDFDNVHRGEPAEDVAYALRMFVGYGLVGAEPPELQRRTRLALSAYGAEFDVPVLLEREYDRAEEAVAATAGTGSSRSSRSSAPGSPRTATCSPAESTQSARNASSRCRSSSTSRRAAAESVANGSTETRASTARHVPATTPSTRNVCATSPFLPITTRR